MEGKNMAVIRLYASLVGNGRRTIEAVPEKYRQDVAAYIASKETK